MKLAMIQDKIIPYEQLPGEYMDRGTFFGDGVYEVLRSYNGRIFALEDHLERFGRSLREIGIEDIDIETVRDKVLRTFEQAAIPNARIYFHITRGSGPRNHSADKALQPNFLLMLTEVPDCGSDKENGVSVSTFPDWRWKRCDIKSLNLLANVLARMDAGKKGCSEAILVNEAGEITEGAASAFFAIRAGAKQLLTRPLGNEILPSITRRHVMQLSQNTGLTVVETALTPAEAIRCDELFLAVTTKDIVPVVEFDGRKIGDGRPGSLTQTLIGQFAMLVAETTR